MLSLGLSRSPGSPLIAHTPSQTAIAPVSPHDEKEGHTGELDLINGFNSLGLQESFKIGEQKQPEYYPGLVLYDNENEKSQTNPNGKIREPANDLQRPEGMAEYGHEAVTHLDSAVYGVIDGLFREEPAYYNRSHTQSSSRMPALARVESAPSLMREHCEDNIHDPMPSLSNNLQSGAPMLRSHSQNLNINNFEMPARHQFEGPKARSHLSASNITRHSWGKHSQPNGVNLKFDLKGDDRLIFEDEYASIKMSRKGESVVLSVSLLAAGFVIGANGLCIRKISQKSGADVQSCTIKSDPPMRVFTVSGVASSIQIAVAIIIHAVKIYNDLETRWRGGECVALEHKVFGIEFLYHPPPPITLGANQKTAPPVNGKGNPAMHLNALNQSTRFFNGSSSGESARPGRYSQHEHRNHGGYAGPVNGHCFNGHAEFHEPGAPHALHNGRRRKQRKGKSSSASTSHHGSFQGQLRDTPSSLEGDDSLIGAGSVDGMLQHMMGGAPPFAPNMEGVYSQEFAQQYLTALQAVGAQLNELSSQSLLYGPYGSGGRFPVPAEGALPASQFPPNGYSLDPNMLLAVHLQMMAAQPRVPLQTNGMVQPQEAYDSELPTGRTGRSDT